MDVRAMTLDGVAWDVRRMPPEFRASRAKDDVSVSQKNQHIGFEALFMISLTGIVLAATPAIVQSDRWWLVFLVPILVGMVWFLYIAKWQVLLVREGTIVHRASVRGRGPAAHVVIEFVDEIQRSKDSALNG